MAGSLDGLASLAYARANFDEAEELAWEALSIYRKLHGEEHADIAGALSDVAVALSGQGDEQAAEPLYRESLAMARRLPDVSDGSLEVYVRRLAITFDILGKLEEAEPLYRESLDLCREIYGQEHARTAFALDNLAIFFESAEDAGQAEPLYRESLAMLRRVYGEEHPEVAQTMGNLADFLIFTKGPSERGAPADFEEARQLHQAALKMNLEFRPDHPFVGDNYSALAEIAFVDENYREAERLSGEALWIYRLKLPEGHAQLVSSKRRLGASLLEQRRFDEAEPLLLESCQALMDLGPESENRGELEFALSNLVELYQAMGRPERSAQYRALLAESAGRE